MPLDPSATRSGEDEENSDVACGKEHYVRLCYTMYYVSGEFWHRPLTPSATADTLLLLTHYTALQVTMIG